MARVLIVGSNRGIGLELVRAYANRGDTVFAACRKTSPDLSAVKNTTILEGFDVSNDSVISKLADCSELPEKLDVVIANSGILINNDFNSLNNTDGLLTQFNTNSVGMYILEFAVLYVKLLLKFEMVKFLEH